MVEGMKDLEVDVSRVGGGLIEVLRREYEKLGLSGISDVRYSGESPWISL